MAKRRPTSQDAKKKAAAPAAAETGEEVLDDLEEAVEEAADQDEAGEPAGAETPAEGFLAPPPPAPRPIPNKPSFDWRVEDGQKVPNLQPGEEVVGEFQKAGLAYVRTTRTRFIFLCTGAEYEKALGALFPRDNFVQAFPQAFPKSAQG